MPRKSKKGRLSVGERKRRSYARIGNIVLDLLLHGKIHPVLNRMYQYRDFEKLINYYADDTHARNLIINILNHYGQFSGINIIPYTDKIMEYIYNKIKKLVIVLENRRIAELEKEKEELIKKYEM